MDRNRFGFSSLAFSIWFTGRRNQFEPSRTPRRQVNVFTDARVLQRDVSCEWLTTAPRSKRRYRLRMRQRDSRAADHGRWSLIGCVFFNSEPRADAGRRSLFGRSAQTHKRPIRVFPPVLPLLLQPRLSHADHLGKPSKNQIQKGAHVKEQRLLGL